jgi:phage terminase large subunit-like protein
MREYHAHVIEAEKYVHDVLSGDISACRWVKLSCQRHIDDRARPDFEWQYSEKRAERACKIISLLPHTKGIWAQRRQLITLEGWQCFIVCSLFGWVNAQGLRRFTELLVMVPRKNAKSTLAAAIGLVLFAADGEHGAEVYAGATTQAQAYKVFTPARLMAMRTPEFCYKFGIDVRTTKLVRLEDDSIFEPIIGKPGDGGNPSCAIVDEFHEHTSPDLYDTMVLGMGARLQPVMLIISTAGSNLAGPCYRRQLYGEGVLAGEIDDDRFFALIYTIDDGDRWDTLEAAVKANPNYGVSIFADAVARELKAARTSAYKQTAYKTKRLNVWAGAASAWMNMDAWKKCPRAKPLETYAGRHAYIGIDLGSVSDLSARVILVDTGNPAQPWALYTQFYLPEQTVEDAPLGADYKAWVKEGFLIATPGNIADYDRVITDIRALRGPTIAGIGYDPYQAVHLATILAYSFDNVLKIPQNTGHLSEPMKHLERHIIAGTLAHDHNPVMAWMMQNVTAAPDIRDNLYPRKKDSDSKIDGVQAALTAGAIAFIKPDNSGLGGWLES